LKTQAIQLKQLDKEEMMACPFVQIRLSTTRLRQASAGDPDDAIALGWRLRETGPE